MPFFELHKFEELVSRFFLVHLLLIRGAERFHNIEKSNLTQFEKGGTYTQD